MTTDNDNPFQSLFGNPTSASELYIAGKSNPSYVPSSSDFTSNEVRTSLLVGQASGKNGS